MGLALAEACPEARVLLDRAAARTGADVDRLLTRGGRVPTEVLQPVLVAVVLGAGAALRAAGSRPAAVAGHSLGELAAWSLAGGIDAVTAVDLAAARGAAMAGVAGGMVAVAPGTPLPDGAVLAADNAPDEWVVAGPEDVLRHVVGRRLPASGAFHGPALRGAAQAFRAHLDRVDPQPLHTPWVGGSGVVRDGEARRALADQLVQPVRFRATLAGLRALGVTDVVLLGVRRVLGGLVRRNPGGLRVHAAIDPASVAEVAARLG